MKTKDKLVSGSIFLTLAFIIYCLIDLIFIENNTEIEIFDSSFNGISNGIVGSENDGILSKNANYKSSVWSWDRNEEIADDDLIHRSAFHLFYEEHKNFHASITNDLIHSEQSKWQNYIKNVRLPKKKYKGRGIVYSVYPKTIAQTLVSIRLHKFYGCNLPIEVWHYNELSPIERLVFEQESGVKVKNMKDYLNQELRREAGKLFAMKGAVLLYTDFKEVLFMDSDNIPVTDVSLLFETPAFKETGTLFWPDYWKTRCDNHIWQLLNLKCTNEYEQESGQILITKTPQVVMALHLALYFQQTQGIYSELLLGDKDTFRLSWRVLGVPYHMIRVNPAALGVKTNDKFCGATMVQHAPMWGSTEYYGEPPIDYHDPNEPTVVFLHMNLLKVKNLNIDNPFAKTIQRFKPSVFPYGKNTFQKDELCCRLESCEDIADHCEIEQIDFDRVLPDFDVTFSVILENLE